MEYNKNSFESQRANFGGERMHGLLGIKVLPAQKSRHDDGVWRYNSSSLSGSVTGATPTGQQAGFFLPWCDIAIARIQVHCRLEQGEI